MLPLGLLRRAEFRSGTAVGLLINFGLYGQLFVLSLYFKEQRGYSALRTGFSGGLHAGIAVAAAAFFLAAALTFAGVPRPSIGS